MLNSHHDLFEKMEQSVLVSINKKNYDHYCKVYNCLLSFRCISPKSLKTYAAFLFPLLFFSCDMKCHFVTITLLIISKAAASTKKTLTYF